MRWQARVPGAWRILNDQWERSYGDLEWRGLVGERILPWYFLAFDGRRTHGYGVDTGASSLCFWQVDGAGISLWLDVRNGGSPVHLGARTLEAAVVRSREGGEGESPFQSAGRFCRALCQKPRMPGTPIYGGNNWYYTYGEKCSAAGLLRDSELLAGLSPAGGNRPFMVIDDGWEPTRLAGPWDRGNAGFPDLPGLASGMSRCGVRPGIWLRPLCTSMPLPDSWRLRYEPPSQSGAARFSILDPSLPEVLDTVRQDIHRLGTWGFELLKHDFSTYDILGRWGFAMNAELTGSGWHFADRSRTTAEIVGAFYRAIRGSAGTAIIIGCNTLGHLAAGLFELQRIGDDTSGREFHRTRRMGVNTLAFRAPQHGAFFAVDADCAAITPQVPWQMAGRWLDLLSRSGTPLFVSADLAAIGPEQKQSLQLALARASKPQPLAEPLDWMQTTTPAKWRFRSDIAEYDWYGPEGDTPFPL